MQTLTVGEFKANFSEVLRNVQNGQEVVISYGKKKEKIAVLMPYDHVKPKVDRPLGLLQGKAGFNIRDGFKMKTNEEFLLS
jgi:prevent-host-death family protein